MRLSETAIAMCKLVTFVQKEIEMAASPDVDLDEYTNKVLKRFQDQISSSARLIVDPISVAGISKIRDYVHVGIDGQWKFSISDPEHMIVTAETDGSIDLDEGIAEIIFNYVND